MFGVAYREKGISDTVENTWRLVTLIGSNPLPPRDPNNDEDEEDEDNELEDENEDEEPPVVTDE